MTDVIDLAEKRQEREREHDDFEPEVRTTVKLRFCRHREHTAVVDARARIVECGGCGVALDPFDVLDRVAKRGDEYLYAVRQTQRLRKELADLEAEEKRTKARLERARESLKKLGES